MRAILRQMGENRASEAAPAASIDRADATQFYFPKMKRVLLAAFCVSAFASGFPDAGFALTPGFVPPNRGLEKANVLPLALDDHFQFRKTKLFLNDPVTFVPTTDVSINFERARINHKVVTNVDRVQRVGNYLTFFWRATKRADLTLRLEYQQAKLGNYVMAKEIDYPHFKGSHQSDFAVLGDDYTAAGRILAWRVLLIEGGKIVALSQSYLWD